MSNLAQDIKTISANTGVPTDTIRIILGEFITQQGISHALHPNTAKALCRPAPHTHKPIPGQTVLPMFEEGPTAA